MTARCTRCNRLLNFQAQRGNKLAYHKCSCGGKYEMIYYVINGRYRNRGGHLFKCNFKTGFAEIIENENEVKG